MQNFFTENFSMEMSSPGPAALGSGAIPSLEGFKSSVDVALGDRG